MNRTCIVDFMRLSIPDVASILGPLRNVARIVISADEAIFSDMHVFLRMLI